MFIKELTLNVEYLKEQIQDISEATTGKLLKDLRLFCNNLLEGIAYYRGLSVEITGNSNLLRFRFLEKLAEAEDDSKVILASLLRQLEHANG